MITYFTTVILIIFIAILILKINNAKLLDIYEYDRLGFFSSVVLTIIPYVNIALLLLLIGMLIFDIIDGRADDTIKSLISKIDKLLK